MAETDEERWGVAANVLSDKVGSGSKHFVEGAKVFVSWGLWGDGGERMYVYGRHRGGGHYIQLVMPSKRLTNFRPTLLKGHHIERAETVGWDWKPTKEEAAALAEQMAKAAEQFSPQTIPSGA